MHVADTWHDDYAKGRVDPDEYMQHYKNKLTVLLKRPC
jgi:hypothetical protein